VKNFQRRFLTAGPQRNSARPERPRTEAKQRREKLFRYQLINQANLNTCNVAKTAQVLPMIVVSPYQPIFQRRITMAKAKSNLVTALFKNRIATEAAVDAILKRGYSRDDISVMMSDATRSKEFALQAKTHAAEGAGIGGAVGGAVGAVLAAIVAVGSTIFLPGLNLVIAGPIAAALAGAGAGAATGGVIGALIGAGIPEYRAKVYEAGLKSGGILIGVEAKTDEEVDRLEELLESVGGEHVRTE
jgi:hypothetical protein